MLNDVIPTPDTLPVHWVWFQILLTFTFVLHLLLMNLVLGGSLLAIGDLVRGKSIDKESQHIPTLIALTINLGVPPLLFVQVLFGNFFYSSSVMMSVYWIMIIPILILAYYGAYIFSRRMDTNSTFGKAMLILSTLLILYIGFMFVNNSTFSIQPDKWSAYNDNPGGTLLNLRDPSFWPRYLHFITAAVAIAGLGKAIWIRFFKKADPEEKEQGIKKNLRIFGFTTMIQFIFGIWFWLALPKDVTMAFMGQNIIATILMMLVLVSAVLIIIFAMRGKLIPSLIQGLFQVILMAVVREIARYTYLDGIFKPSQLENVHQSTPLIAFLLVFILGLFLLFYMYKLAVEPKIKKS
ncbi:hypothetical protein ACE1ET_11720 [Saccharicrinis sp. FJH62]|uniref:hypothetical protein n=1 Tax=Saccharicrinis sp. FJH62 TaxID=3344657 RepID=UPI0035D49C80